MNLVGILTQHMNPITHVHDHTHTHTHTHLRPQEAINVVTKIQQAGKPPSSAVQELQKMARALWLKNEGVADDTTIIVCYCGGSGT